jgi:hypothetical protein
MKKLVISFHPSKSLDKSCLRDIWSIYSLHHNVYFEEFLSRTRNQFTCIALYRRRRGASLVGFTGLRMEFLTLQHGSRILTIYFGQTYVLDDYRGRQLLPWTGLLFVLKCRLRYPLLPIYMWYDAISYKSYMILARHVKEFFPRRGVSTPAVVREIIDQVGARYYPGQYDRTTGRVIKPSNRLKEHVARLSPVDLEEPDIAYYVTRNPGHAKGDGLLCVLPGSLANVFHFASKVFRRSFLGELNRTRRTG